MSRSAKNNTAKNKKIFKLFSLSILVASIAIFGQRYFAFNSIDTNPPKILGKTTNFIFLDKQLTLSTSNSATATQVSAKIVSAQLTDEFTVGSENSEAVDGKIFLILETELTNSRESDIEINLAETIKIKQTAKEPIAAIYPSDSILIPAGSTAVAKLGFSLNKPTQNLTLLARTEPFVYTVLPLHND